ncbi:MAG: ribosome silencing factor [Solobacterium sp.]|nr:ribosome silencing factor [Solobacterium sp.]
MAELLELTVDKLTEKLAEDILVIDMSSVNPFTDHFVIATARNPRHAASLADEVIQTVEKNGYSVRTREGADGSTWILVDLNDVIVHIFTEDARSTYKLENLWGDLPITRPESNNA